MLDHYDTILTALHERRNRLIQLDMAGATNQRAVPTLRQRINECTDAIHALQKARPHV